MPSASALAVHTRTAQLQDKVEQQHLKRLVLNYEQREEAEEMKGTTSSFFTSEKSDGFGSSGSSQSCRSHKDTIHRIVPEDPLILMQSPLRLFRIERCFPISKIALLLDVYTHSYALLIGFKPSLRLMDCLSSNAESGLLSPL